MKKRFFALLTGLCLLAGCGGAQSVPVETPLPPERIVTGGINLQYAEQFDADYYSDGSALVTIAGTDRFLVVPEGGDAPADLDGDIVVLRQPLQSLYLAASSAMDHLIQLDALDEARFTSTALGSWELPEVRAAIEAGDILYAGKYSAPDFELLLSESCSLAVESTMIFHSPDIREQLEALGVPVLVERSSYESHPLGRVEWIKLYGLLLGKEAEAEAFFNEQVKLLSELKTLPSTEQTVAFFYFNSAGAVVVRKPGDYVSKMIELAGGEYVFSSLGSDGGASSTMNMELEAFYAGAKDADVLIYSSIIDGRLDTLAQLLEKSDLLADFKAVQTGNVWCAEHDIFQKSTAAAGMIADFNTVLGLGAEAPDQLTFLHRLK